MGLSETVWEMQTEIEHLRKERAELRQALVDTAGKLNMLRADVEQIIWPSSGFASYKEETK